MWVSTGGMVVITELRELVEFEPVNLVLEKARLRVGWTT